MLRVCRRSESVSHELLLVVDQQDLGRHLEVDVETDPWLPVPRSRASGGGSHPGDLERERFEVALQPLEEERVPLDQDRRLPVPARDFDVVTPAGESEIDLGRDPHVVDSGERLLGRLQRRAGNGPADRLDRLLGRSVLHRQEEVKQALVPGPQAMEVVDPLATGLVVLVDEPLCFLARQT